MSKQVDERVVSMQFDNRHFESNVQTSLNTLDKLKRSLNMDGAAKGFANLDTAANKVNFSGLSDAVDSVKVKFSALQVMATTALANITNSAVNAGKRIASSLTIAPVKSGFQEYELQINSVQTIMSNTGDDVKTVNAALDELNEYADLTIYNFSEMTSNAATFTAALGKGSLDKTMTSLKGIGNWAAYAGAGSSDMARATFQLSQALSQGSIRLQDWMSIEHTAGMAGQNFQNEFKKTAKSFGTDVDAIIKKNGSFRESLRDGWLTTDVFMETMKRFANNQAMTDAATKIKTFSQLVETTKEALGTGWASVWREIVGDFEEAKALWTSIGDVLTGENGIITKMSKARLELWKGWGDGGGRTAAIEALKNTFEGIVSFITPIKEAFREIFPRTTSEQLIKITENIRDFTAKLKLSDEQAAKLKSTFKGLFSAIGLGLTIIKQVVGAAAKIIGALFGFGDGILSITGGIGDFISRLHDSIKETNLFGLALDKAVAVIKMAVEKIKEFFSFIGSKVSAPGLEGILGVMRAIWNIAKKIGEKIQEVFSQFAEGFRNALGNGEISGALSAFNLGILGAILLKVRGFISGFTEMFDNAGGIVENIKEIFGGVTDTLKVFQQSIKADILKKIAISIAILAASLLVIAMIDPERMATALAGITVLFYNLTAALSRFTKVAANLKGAIKGATLMIGMATAILILAAALKTLSSLDWEGLAKGIIGVVALMTMMIKATELMAQDDKTKKIIKGAGQMLIMAAALNMLAVAMKMIGSMSWEELAKGLGSLVVLLGSLVVAAKLMETDGKLIVKGAGQMLIMAVALNAVAVALRIAGSIGWQDLAKGLIGVVVVTGVLVSAAKLMENDGKTVVKGAGQMLIMATALTLVAVALKSIAALSWYDLAKGLIGVVVSLGTLVGALVVMSKLKQPVNKSASAIFVLVLALDALAVALKILGELSWSGIAKGLIAITVSLGAMVAALALMSKIKMEDGSLMKLSASILVMTLAIDLLVPALKALGSMSWSGIAKSLIALAGSFAVIGLAGLVLKPLVPTILALSAAIALFGVGCLAAGTGIMLLATGIAALATAVAGGSTAIVSAIISIVEGIAGLIPMIIQKIGEGIVAFCQVIASSATEIGNAIKSVILALVDVIVECVPALADGALKLVVGVLDALVKYTPMIVDRIFDFLVAVLEGVAENLPRLIQAAVDVIMSFFSGIVDALSNMDWSVLGKGLLGMGIISAMLVVLSAMATLVPSAMLGVLGVGAVIAELALVLSAIGALQQIPGLSWLIEQGGELLQNIGNAIGKMIGGLVGGVLEGVADSLPEIGTSLSEFMSNLQPFLDGAKSITPQSMEGVRALAGVILTLTATNILDGLTRWLTGGSSLANFGQQLVPFGEGMKAYGEAVSGINPQSIKNSAKAAAALSELAANLPNSGGVLAFLVGENDIGDFGKQLVPFGEGMKEYADAVTGIDPGVVKDSANAALALAELAENLPNSGGVLGFLAGENDIGDFGSRLVPFGKGLKDYADAVDEIDASVIKDSATAATVLAELADTLPNSGGLAAFFSGENDIAYFAEQLVPLGNSLKSYSEAVSGIDPDAVQSSANAAKALAELADNIPNSGGLAAIFAGDNSIASFGMQLVPFGEGMKAYSDAISGIDTDTVTASATAAESLAVLAENIPNSGGLFSIFTGSSDLSTFASELVPFGQGMKDYANSISGIDADAVSASATAAQALAELTKAIPSVGGIVNAFTGVKDLGMFGAQLVAFGEGMKKYASSITGIDADAVSASATAANALAELAAVLPETGGLWQFLAGEKDIGSFGEKLEPLGAGIQKFSQSVSGIDEKAVTASAKAAKSFSELVKNLSEIDTTKLGDCDALSKFIDDLPGLGSAMQEYGSALGSDFPAETITASANAAKAIAELANSLPRIGGAFEEWFGKTQSLTTFTNQLQPFGEAMGAYSKALGSGFNAENVTASGNAAKAIAELANNLPPDTDGLFAKLSGVSSLSDFAGQLTDLGKGMSAYSNALGKDFSADNVTASANAAKALAELANNLPPDTDGFFAKLSGISNLSDFSTQLTDLGKGMSAYSNALGSDFSADTVTASADAAKAIAALASNIPPTAGSFMALFTGDRSLTTFAAQLEPFGKEMKKYSDAVKGIEPDQVEASAKAVKGITSVIKALSGGGLDGLSDIKGDLPSMKDDLSSIGAALKAYSASVAGVKADGADATKKVASAVVNILNSISGLDINGVDDFVTAINKLADARIGDFAKTFGEASDSFESAGKSIISALSKGISGNKESATKAMNSVVTALSKAVNSKKASFKTAGTAIMTAFVNGLSSKKSEIPTSFTIGLSMAVASASMYVFSFYSIGVNIAQGLANGIRANMGSAVSAAVEMAEATERASKRTLREKSPSRVFIAIGRYIAEGLAKGIGKYSYSAENSATDMANATLNATKKVLSRLSNTLNGSFDTTPTIRPVVDLSDVESGVAALDRMTSRDFSIGATANIGSISRLMRENQNGDNSDVISAINDLGRKLGKTSGDVYNLGNITYDDGSNVSDAVKSLIRAVRVERRV